MSKRREIKCFLICKHATVAMRMVNNTWSLSRESKINSFLLLLFLKHWQSVFSVQPKQYQNPSFWPVSELCFFLKPTKSVKIKLLGPTPSYLHITGFQQTEQKSFLRLYTNSFFFFFKQVKVRGIEERDFQTIGRRSKDVDSKCQSLWMKIIHTKLQG